MREAAGRLATQIGAHFLQKEQGDKGLLLGGVPNMPGTVQRTSTFVLTNTTLPFAQLLVCVGTTAALDAEPPLSSGVNVWRGHETCWGAESLDLPFTPQKTFSRRFPTEAFESTEDARCGRPSPRTFAPFTETRTTR